MQFENKNVTSYVINPGGGGDGLGIYTDRDQQSIFLGFEFQKSVFFWVLVIAAIFFGFSNKCCIFKCFMSSTLFLGPILFTKYFSKDSSYIYYHLVVNFA